MATDVVSPARVLDTLESVFGYSSFRPLQEEIVSAILHRRDVFVLMPTGGGKSLCYQLPALLLPGTTVVVSPLIALMKDQVDALRTHGVAATFINSSLDSAEVSRRQSAVAQGRVKLLYVAPERLMLPGFLRLLASLPIAGFAIDEAHCISEWGHDFRPEYRELKRLRELFPDVPLSAFTATATVRVQADIKAQLGLHRAAVFQGSFNRPNLFYEVRHKLQPYDQLAAYVRSRPEASGIIYCASRQSTEDLARRLRLDGFKAEAYHAGLTGDQRRRRQEAFSRDDVRIIVATIAFGMGIDKPDVRYVIHYDLPKSLEGYYQESGRAGRDGEPSDCILFFSAGDIVKQKHFLAEKSPAEREIGSWQLQQMADWAEHTDCRRVALLAYFDETFEGQEGACCDVCRTPVEMEDVTVPAQKFLACVKRTGERFGAGHVINVLRGSREARVLSFGHDQLSTYGIGRERSDAEWRHLARSLVRLGHVRQDANAFNVLKITESGRQVLFKEEPVHISPLRQAAARKSAATPQPHPELFERLRVLRKQLADENDIAPYMVLHDRTLMHMAATLPDSHAGLLTIPGIGERKVRDFGRALLAAIAEYRAETGAVPAAPAQDAAPPRKSRGSLGDSAHASAQLFRTGMAAAAIAAERGLSLSTIEGHLADAVEAGVIDDGIDRLVAPQKRHAIEAAVAELGGDFIGPLRTHLGEEYSYGEIRIVRAALRGRDAHNGRGN